MGISGAIEIAEDTADKSAASIAVQDRAPEFTREIDDVSLDTPAWKWPESVRTLYRAEYVERLYREQRFLFSLGFAVALISVALDQLVNPDMAAEGMFWRLVILSPLTIAGMVAASRGWTTAMAVLLGACPIAFMGIVVHLSFHLPPAFAGSYLTATGIILGLGNLVMPFSLRALALFNVAFIATVALVIALTATTNFWLNAHVLGLLVAVSLATVPIVLRLEGLRWRTFLLNLKARTAAAELRKANRELRILSESDPLTGVLNRRGFENLFDQQIAAASQDSARRQDKGRLAIVMIDIDHFKHFNDTHGHQSGDACLAMVASHLQGAFEDLSGALCRYGGEEFIGAFREQYEGHALEVGEQIRTMVASLLVPIGPYSSVKGRSLVTASVGIGLGDSLTPDLTREDAQRIRETLIEMADTALYSAKRDGRNRVELVELDSKELIRYA